MRQYRWGILAPGKITNKFTVDLKTIPEAVLYAVGSRDIGRAEAFAKKYGCEKAYGSYQELVNDPLVDIIYVATPHPWHEEAAVLCLNNGKAVLCEKPIAVNARQTDRMIQCARKNNVFLMEAMYRRFLPIVRKTRELLAGGAIGNVRFVYSGNGFRAAVDPASRLFSPEYGGGALLDMGIYNLSLCSMIFGKQPDHIQSHMSIGSTGVDEETTALFSYKEGQSALLFTAIRLSTQHDVKIIGENGRIELPLRSPGNSLSLYTNEGVQEFTMPCETLGYQFEALEVMRCLEEGLKESPVMPLDESLAIMETSDRIRRENKLRYPWDEE